MQKIKIPKDEMLNILDDGADVVRDKIAGTSRWSIKHELIFKRDGKLYRVHYSVGATESQDESPWEYTDPVECTEVRAVQVSVTDYVTAE